jgi:protein-S-isoprenylcysteine O-methyltransferase Ste14
VTEGAAPDHAGVAFHPPLLLGICLLSGFVLRWLAPATFLAASVATLAGPIITAVSLGLFAWAAVSMRGGGGSIPTGEPTDAIVARGPYGFTRNPIYLAMLLLQVGVGLWANSLWFIGLAAVSAALLSWGVIAREERYLEGKFGSEYSDYRARVRRWM